MVWHPSLYLSISKGFQMSVKQSVGFQVMAEWLNSCNRKPHQFQLETWESLSAGASGLLNAPTGFGKTYALLLGSIIQYINENPKHYKQNKNIGLQMIWLSPLRALGKDIARAIEEVLLALEIPWKVAIRNGDTSNAERARQKKQMPEILVTTPESLHLLLAQKGYPNLFKSLRWIIADEWHELLGSKRGVQVELAFSRLVGLSVSKQLDSGSKVKHPALQIWGISATIGNLEEAKSILLAPLGMYNEVIKKDLIIAKLKKKIILKTIFPEEIETYPWAGHLGLKLADKLLPIIEKNQSSLLFINTRGMSERWYQTLLSIAPELSGTLALHHSSMEQHLRLWVEEALHQGILKAVVCTSGLDLGVDFLPVEAAVQVGSPKSVARFMQRAGRSGHQPGATSMIYFLPTHSLEILEAAALREAIEKNVMENRLAPIRCFDVLMQYCCTLAISEGFYADALLHEIRHTHCFAQISDEEWEKMLQFLTKGGVALQQYDDYHKMLVTEGWYHISSRSIAMRHRLNIGTIVSDAMLKVKFAGGKEIGVIEEWFVSRLLPGEVFTLAGRNLEFVQIREMSVMVRKSNATKSIVPSWMGGRMPMSSSLGKMLRKKLDDASRAAPVSEEPEMTALIPLLEQQRKSSMLPAANELLIEHISTKDGYHLFVYPFEGRLVHEAMAAILAYRLSKKKRISFSFAMNDYGFELLSDQPIEVNNDNVYTLFSEDGLFNDIQSCINASEMASRKFRDIAVIGGLLFQGMPGKKVKQKHLQSSSSLLFRVFSQYEPHNLLLRQAYQEVMEQQMDEPRLRDMLQRIQKSKIIITHPTELTPFCFPIKVDSIREKITSETLEDQIRKLRPV